MNKYLKNLNRIEFVVTMACTGKCKHCSQGEHKSHENINKDIAADAVRKIANEYKSAEGDFNCLLSAESSLNKEGCINFFSSSPNFSKQIFVK